MEIFSDLLLNLYRLAQTSPPTEFQTCALDAIRKQLPFDSAIWATGAIRPEGATPHSMFVYRQPPEMIESWARITPRDTLIFEAYSKLGLTVNAALGSDPVWQARFNTDMRSLVKRYGMEHILITMTATRFLRLYTAVSFFRADPEQPFTGAEQLFKQNIMPHLAEAWNINRFNFLHPAHEGGTQMHRVRAICDQKGMIYNASPGFEELMLAEWPTWQGPHLPGELLDTLSGKNNCNYIGQATVASFKTLNDMLLLSIRRLSKADQLSPREFEVASRFGQGMDHRHIADDLHIAPATVRNHLQAIYAKLGVSNKIEMARIILEAGE